MWCCAPLQFLDGEVVAGGALKVLQDLRADVFVSERTAEALVLGVAASDGAASMIDTAIGSVRYPVWTAYHRMLAPLEAAQAGAAMQPWELCCRQTSHEGLGYNVHALLYAQLRCQRFLAAARCKLWWMTPEWGSSARDLTPETQFLLLELEEGGPYAIMLPLIDRNTFRGTLRPPGCAAVP
jgi:hypothetical protein